MNQESKTVTSKVFVVGDKPIKKRKFNRLAISLVVGGMIGHLIGNGLDSSGAFDEVFSYFTPVDEKILKSIGEFDEKTQWVSHNYPWIEIGKTKEGYDFIKMLDAWATFGEGKIKESDLFYISSQVQFMAPTLIARDDESVLKAIANEAYDAHINLIVKYPELYENLKHHLENVGEYDHPENNTDRTIFYSLPEYANAMYHKNEDIDYTYDQAISLIESTAKITGLKSLQMPLQYWNDPNHLAISAGLLININNDLKAKSGLDGGVLGINGRVNLRLKSPPVNFIDLDDNGGFLNIQTGGMMFFTDNGIFIDGGWDSLYHEVGHAYDLMVGMTGYKNTSNHFFSTSNAGILRRSDYPGFVRTARVMKKKLDPDKSDLGFVGMAMVNSAKKTGNESYWLSEPEFFARTFEYYFPQENAKINMHTVEKTQMIGDAIEYFDKFFEITKKMNLTGENYITFDQEETQMINKIIEQTSYETYVSMYQDNNIKARKLKP